MQEGDSYPEWPEDAEAPEGESEVSFRLAAAETIKGRGNELFKQERHRDAIAKYNKARAQPCTLLRCLLHVGEADARPRRQTCNLHRRRIN